MKHISQLMAGLFVATFLIISLGCGKSSSITATSPPSDEGAQYLFATEPPSAQGVRKARATVKDADDITVVGRIGGDINPWIEGQAAFLLVDESLKPCNEREGDGCETPWDYCCDADTLPSHKVMIKIIDSTGKTLQTDARTLLGLRELQTVVVRGKAKQDESGNLTVIAEGLYVRK